MKTVGASELMAGLKEIASKQPKKFAWFSKPRESTAGEKHHYKWMKELDPDLMLVEAIKACNPTRMTEAEYKGAALTAPGYHDPLTIALEDGNEPVIEHLLQLIEKRALRLETIKPRDAESLRMITKQTLTEKLTTIVDDQHLEQFKLLLKYGADITKNAAWQTGFYYTAAANGHVRILECLEAHRQIELNRLAAKRKLNADEQAYQSSLLELPKQTGSTGISASQRAKEFGQRAKEFGQRAMEASKQMVELLQQALTFTPPQPQTQAPA